MYFLEANFSEGQYSGTLRLGTLGYCLNDNCQGPQVGYEFSECARTWLFCRPCPYRANRPLGSLIPSSALLHLSSALVFFKDALITSSPGSC
jgi:hypothetical protein